MKSRIAIAGAGFAGAVLARELADSGRFEVTVFDERSHVAGNCHTSRDEKTNVMIHRYGPHIFNTSREDVWAYVNKWTRFEPYVNRVKAVTEKGVFSLPINLLTINQFFGKKMGPAEARDFIGSLGESVREPATFEDQALKFLGRDLYKNFFYGYTKKQWGVEPEELPASILRRLPVRFSYDDNYYNQKFQGIPVEGYTAIVQKILDHESISVRLGERLEPENKDAYDHVFWSGPIDAFYRNSLGRLRYRTLKFERFDESGDFQGNAVINYCESSVPYTRITEHKHFAPWERHDETVCFREYSKECEPGETPYYPLRLEKDKTLLKRYVDLADREKNVTFIGRLGTYRYLDMHVVIGESLD
ncbi:MAG TPA: UDP-galactopyranose mutase, partial [Pseudobdellovibrionaceae bacterium]|nr:UDP-galactopyranose mutase [Pseudobdellovibrionaceae bacterium]